MSLPSEGEIRRCGGCGGEVWSEADRFEMNVRGWRPIRIWTCPHCRRSWPAGEIARLRAFVDQCPEQDKALFSKILGAFV